MNSGGSIFKGFAGVYVFYQGIQLLIGLKNGNPAFSVPVTILLIICFLGFGGYFLYSSVRDYKVEKEKAAEAKKAAEEQAALKTAPEDEAEEQAALETASEDEAEEQAALEAASEDEAEEQAALKTAPEDETAELEE